MKQAQHGRKNGVKAPGAKHGPKALGGSKSAEEGRARLKELNEEVKRLKGPMSAETSAEEGKPYKADLECTFIGIERMAGLALHARTTDFPDDEPLTREEGERLLTYIEDLRGALQLIQAAAFGGMDALGL